MVGMVMTEDDFYFLMDISDFGWYWGLNSWSLWRDENILLVRDPYRDLLDIWKACTVRP
jgi:hypothetical protein